MLVTAVLTGLPIVFGVFQKQAEKTTVKAQIL